MKTLHLLRHAKSSWQAADLDDHDRDLNERGRRDAPRMGRALASRLAPLAVNCSSAVRARRTLEGLCDGWPALGSLEHFVHESLYTFDFEDLLNWLQEYQGHGNDCFIVGHNPALTDLCNHLVGRRALDNLPTCGYLELSLPVAAWNDVTEGIATLEHWQFPKDLD